MGAYPSLQVVAGGARVHLHRRREWADLQRDYGLDTTRTENADHTAVTVSVPVDGVSLPAAVRTYLMVDTYPAAREVLTP